jgi:hypothetical protein
MKAREIIEGDIICRLILQINDYTLRLGDIALLKTYGLGPYTNAIKAAEEDIKKHQDKVKELIGIKESDTGILI